ncbi:hypothetical protein [Micromonospora sp. 4G55]|uniref:hypothetical protein n=1 Tax=Micromonospora sp. 4G55 TaxID=2806102 RepID=UPI001A63EDBB|nr:hypothetical protein [Micromonospora sp. 4G55]MBM0255510.1 hypothetical protein [Micromonospora sp. 4G55]
MFDFGISGYRPQWVQARSAIAAAHGRRLAALAGQTLHHVWLVWDLDADEWFPDCPVVLAFDDDQVEVNHQKTDDLSVTFSSIDLAQPVVWPTSDGFSLAWRADPLPELAALHGQQLDHAELLEWIGGTMADGSVAVGFTFTEGQLTVYNALDENGLEFDPPSQEWRQHALDG